LKGKIRATNWKKEHKEKLEKGTKKNEKKTVLNISEQFKEEWWERWMNYQDRRIWMQKGRYQKRIWKEKIIQKRKKGERRKIKAEVEVKWKITRKKIKKENSS